MTLKDLREKDGDVLRAEDVAKYLHVAPQLLREQAREDPSKLGFRVIVIGTQTLIPKRPFVQFMMGEKQIVQIQDEEDGIKLRRYPRWQIRSSESLPSDCVVLD